MARRDRRCARASPATSTGSTTRKPRASLLPPARNPRAERPRGRRFAAASSVAGEDRTAYHRAMAEKQIEAEQLSRAALQLLEQGKVEAAAACMKRAAAASPTSAEIWCNLS